jgi:hypothetical protein
MKYWICILGVWLLCSTLVVATDAEGQKWLNLPDTPLKFALLANGYTLSLTNVSSKRTKRYTLGCVDWDSHKVTRKLRAAAVKLGPGKSSFGNLGSYAADFEACETSHSALSVIAVEFADGHSWMHKAGSGS